MTTAQKEHKGIITDWLEERCGDYGLGYIITGLSEGHPQFDGRLIHTSYIIKRDGNEIETLNSRYTLGDS